MSEKRYLECDECSHRDDITHREYGGHSRHWVTLTKPRSESGERIPAGVLTFCSDECVMKYVWELKQEKRK